METLPTSCQPLDDLLNGGITQGIITKIYGEAGSGKTNLCLQTARECVKHGYKVIYINTEGTSIQRLNQICTNNTTPNILHNILFYTPKTLQEQEQIITKSLTTPQLGLLIIDTINKLYRSHLTHDPEAASRSFIRQMTTLQIASREQNLFMIITEQVYTDKNGTIQPFTPQQTKQIPQTILHLSKTTTEQRQATLLKHDKTIHTTTTNFTICQNGLI